MKLHRSVGTAGGRRIGPRPRLALVHDLGVGTLSQVKGALHVRRTVTALGTIAT
jgi:hypothetical protein